MNTNNSTHSTYSLPTQHGALGTAGPTGGLTAWSAARLRQCAALGLGLLWLAWSAGAATVDPSFRTPVLTTTNGNGNLSAGRVSKIFPLPDGKILLVGQFNQADGQGVPGGLMRLNANGTRDLSFNSGGTGANDYTMDNLDAALAPDGKIYITAPIGGSSGELPVYNGISFQRLARVNADGMLDSSFSPAPVTADGKHNNFMSAPIAHPNGVLYGVVDNLLASYGTNGTGGWSRTGGSPFPNISDYLPSGQNNFFDSLFLATYGNKDYARDKAFYWDGYADFQSPVFIQPGDGKLLVSTLTRDPFSTTGTNMLIRLFPDGTLDPTFRITNTETYFDDVATHVRDFVKIAPQVTGKTLGALQIAQYRYDAMGNGEGYYAAPTCQLVRYNSDGSLDTSFAPASLSSFWGEFVIQPDGKVIVFTADGFPQFFGGTNVLDFTMIRLNADGSRDNTYRRPSALLDNLPLATGLGSGVGLDLVERQIARARASKLTLLNDGSLIIAGQDGQLTKIGADYAPVISSQPVSVAVYYPTDPEAMTMGSVASLSVSAYGTGPLSYQWLSNGIPIAGEVNTNLTFTMDATRIAGYSVAVSNALGVVTSAMAYVVHPGPPVVFQPPSGRTVTNGFTAPLAVAAFGEGALSYQWQRNGANVPNATNAALTLAGVTPAQAGDYTVIVGNAAGSVTSAPPATLTVLVPAQITVPPPASVTNFAGSTAQFGVTATGTAPLAYQWFKGGSPVSGATGNMLTLPNVQPAQAGNYFVVITNVAGAVTSSVTALAVLLSPVAISAQPVGGSFSLGQSFTLSVTASGTPPLSYQWQFNGTNLAGATGASLALANLAVTNAGRYRVLVGNAAGTNTSTDAVLRFFGDLQMYAGMLLTGEPGDRYRVEYAEVLGGVTNWVPVVTNFYHPGGVTVFFDPNSPGRPRRFYRSLFLTNDPLMTPQ